MRSRVGPTLLPFVMVCLLALAGCTAAPPGPSASTSTAADGILPGYRNATTDQFSPLIISALEPDPIPVKGSDDRYHVAYELSVFNDAPRDATITKVETLAGHRVIATLDQQQVAPDTLLTADYSSAQMGSAAIPAGRTVIIVFRDAYPTKKAIPRVFTHRISATFAPPKPGQSAFAAKYPDQVTQPGGTVTMGDGSPVVIGPPLAGADWVAMNGLQPDALNPHSNVLIPVGGRINAAELYGIDFIKVDPKADPSTANINGDPRRNSSNLAFAQPLLAVAAATVVRVVSDQPDATPNVAPDGTMTLPPEFGPPLDLFTGNVVILDLGNGVYATYAHMKEGSARVKVGDRVRRGQVIGEIGNSGNSTEAHLHFQLQRGPLTLTADNVPYVIDRFTAGGTFSAQGVVDEPAPGPRRDELPLGNSLSSFATLGR